MNLPWKLSVVSGKGGNLDVLYWECEASQSFSKFRLYCKVSTKGTRWSPEIWPFHSGFGPKSTLSSGLYKGYAELVYWRLPLRDCKSYHRMPFQWDFIDFVLWHAGSASSHPAAADEGGCGDATRKGGGHRLGRTHTSAAALLQGHFHTASNHLPIYSPCFYLCPQRAFTNRVGHQLTAFVLT